MKGAKKVDDGGGGSQRVWAFGNVKLDEATLELRVDGKLVVIERRPLEVLMHLLRHAGEIVTKDELISDLWPGRIVTETVLAKAVGKLRAALSDDDQTLIKTMHGMGYRLVAKVELKQARSEPTVHFTFKPGDHPPARPRWTLVRQLGAGGQGEAWLASHDKTHEQRVFKFAINQQSLTSLKREITLFRLLNDSLGDKASIVMLRDWNLEQAPCFLEADYVVGGNLAEWAERNGGLANIAMHTRIEIAAQVAESLAAVHSVGVLHKDLKPSNLLVKPRSGGSVQVLLADLGSGGVMDASRLNALGITRLGFTKSLALAESSAATPLYLAPELLAGQPPTVKGDIYALGVILFQLVAGDFRKVMSAGWERDVHDEILRECIADAAQGTAAHRLGDASLLAARLRSLDEERAKRLSEREAEKRARELERAIELARSSQAVAEFLSRDLFSVVGSRPLRDLTVRELLETASSKLAHRFHDMPLAAAQIHGALGNAFWTMESFEEARAHLDQALTALEGLGMAGSELALPLAAQLMLAEFTLGKGLSSMSRFQAVLDAGRVSLGSDHPAVLALTQQLGWMRYGTGEWLRAAADLRELLAGAENGPSNALHDTALVQLGRVLTALADYPAALSALQRALDNLTRKHGSQHLSVAQLRPLIGEALLRMNRFNEAEAELVAAENLLGTWTEHDSAAQLVSVRYLRAQLRLAQGRIEEAVSGLERVLKDLEPLTWMKRSGFIGEVHLRLATAYEMAERHTEASQQMQNALAISESASGKEHPQTQMARIGLARVLDRLGDATRARTLVSSVNRQSFASRVGNQHPALIELDQILASSTPGDQRRPSRVKASEPSRPKA